MAFQFNFTQDQLQQFLPQNQHVEHWFEALAKILPDYDITTVPRVASFLGETYVESAGYTAIQENLNYRPETLMKIFGNHFPGGLSEATQYCNQPNKQELLLIASMLIVWATATKQVVMVGSFVDAV